MAPLANEACHGPTSQRHVLREIDGGDILLPRIKIAAKQRPRNKRARPDAVPARTQRKLRSTADASPCQESAPASGSGGSNRQGALFPSPGQSKPASSQVSKAEATGIKSPQAKQERNESCDTPNDVNDKVLGQAVSQAAQGLCSTPWPVAEQIVQEEPALEAAEGVDPQQLPQTASDEEDDRGRTLLQEREARIAMIQSKMGALRSAQADLAATAAGGAQRKTAHRRTLVQAPPQRRQHQVTRHREPSRYSARNRNKPPPSYSEVLPVARSDAAPAARRPAQRASRQPSGSQVASATAEAQQWLCTPDPCLRTDSKVWYQSDPDTSVEAQVQANNAAVDCENRLMAANADLAPSQLKERVVAAAVRMTWSKVDSGFWLSLPTEFVKGMLKKWGLTRFDNKDAWKMTAVPVDVVHGALEDRFLDPDLRDPLVGEVVFLPRDGTTAGLSGGWRAVSIMQRLQTNDWVVFEVVDGRGEVAPGPAKPRDIEETLRLRVHIFRARDFDPRFVGDDDMAYGRTRWTRVGEGAGGDGDVGADKAAERDDENAPNEENALNEENACAARNGGDGTE
eukprot:jgi/Ulvmu1/2148/UM129_0007.1